jgi:hypothetical protein
MTYFERPEAHLAELLWTTVSVLEDVHLEAALDLGRTGEQRFHRCGQPVASA